MLKSLKYISLIFIFTACAVGPDYKVPKLKTFDTLDKEYKSSYNNLEVHNWWKKFNDPTLNKLINIAKESNLDIKTAYLNIKKSRLSLNMSEDDFLPNAAIGSGAGRGQLSENSNPPGMGGVEANKFQVGLSVSWEIDLFGRIQRTVEAKKAKLQADTYMYQNVLLTLKAEVITTYIQIRNLEDRLKVANNNIHIQEEFFTLTKNLKEAGSASKLDVLRANTNLLLTKAYLPSFEANKNALIQKISFLLAKPSDEIKTILDSSESFIPFINENDLKFSTNLLRQRPDIRISERNLAAQTALIGVANSALYPNLTLSGFLGYESFESGTLFDAKSQLWNIGTSFLFPIFNREKIKNAIKGEETKAKMAFNEYKKAVLKAVSEVNSNISFYKNEKIKYIFLKEASSLNLQSLNLAKLRYENGLSSFQEVLDSQRQGFLTDDKLSLSKSAISLYYVKINKALGAGWKDDNQDNKNNKNKGK